MSINTLEFVGMLLCFGWTLVLRPECQMCVFFIFFKFCLVNETRDISRQNQQQKNMKQLIITNKWALKLLFILMFIESFGIPSEQKRKENFVDEAKILTCG